MRILIYLGTIAIMLMAFEVKASWQEFESAQIDIAPWLYEESTDFNEWTEYITLGSLEYQTIRVEEKTLSFKNSIVAVAQRVTNLSTVPYCFIIDGRNSKSTINTFLRSGRTILSPNETVIIGGYRINPNGRNWQANWSFQATKRLENCR
ncbi:hypothetical protein [Halobacteriovorax sp.]|uniref:hypothetical protein n=1 Tax=Halobacteriovorax sp. TaxID=2020862 RepID=UPI00356AC2D4